MYPLEGNNTIRDIDFGTLFTILKIKGLKKLFMESLSIYFSDIKMFFLFCLITNKGLGPLSERIYENLVFKKHRINILGFI